MPAKKTPITPEPKQIALGSLRHYLTEAGHPTRQPATNVLWTEINGKAIEIERVSPGAVIIRRGAK